MFEFESENHKETYLAYETMHVNNPQNVHVSGNGEEMVVYENLGDGSVLAKIFVFEENAFATNALIMSKVADLCITDNRAPLFYKSLNPEFFEDNEVNVELLAHKSTPAARAFAKFAETTMMEPREWETTKGFNANSENLLVSTYDEATNTLCVVTRGYDEAYENSRFSSGAIALEAFSANAERATMIRKSILAYYGSELLEV